MQLKKRKLFNIIGYGAVLVWLVMMGVLVKRTYFQTAPVDLVTPGQDASLEESETWMAIYHGDDKIGFAQSRLIEDTEHYVVVERAVMNLRAIGAVHRVSTQLNARLNHDASLRSFVFVLDAGMIHFEARGRVEGQHLALNTGFSGETRESQVILKETPYLAIGLWPYLLKKGIRVGASYRFSLFDPSIMAQKPVEVTVVDREEIVLEGTRWEAYKVKTVFAGIEVLTWIGPKGERLKEESLMGLRMVRSTEETAKIGLKTDPEVDLAEAVSIPSNKVLTEPSRLEYLKIRLEGIDPAGLDLDTGRQRLTDSVLEIRLESGEPESVNDHGSLSPYLQPTPFIQSDHPRIKAVAGEITGQVKEAEAKARRILNWVHESIDKRATVSVPNALDTLHAKAGDCNEHAALFAALLRAAGIPAKISVGVVYTRNRFYYHAWNEIYLGRWMTADALMGQIPADVTHIKFVEGDLDRQADMVRVIGQVKLRILEAQ